MPLRLPKTIFDAKRNDIWSDPRNTGSRRFIHYALRVRDVESDSGHTAGGESKRKAAKCPECKKPLVLLWDLDLRDPAFPDYVRYGFFPATRLPFYMCWNCCVASYCVPSDKKIHCFAFDGRSEKLEIGESPLRNAPRVLDRRAIGLERISSTLDALFSLADTVGFKQLDRDEKEIVRDFLGRRADSDWDIPFSQVGGTPLATQGHWSEVCPNRKCPASKLEHPYAEIETKFLMKELALIHCDDEPILDECCFQFLYYVCTVCFSLRAEYRCS